MALTDTAIRLAKAGKATGGYQPAQKWLKDRKGRALSWDDIRHYQRIIKILVKTDRIVGEIELTLDGGGTDDA